MTEVNKGVDTTLPDAGDDGKDAGKAAPAGDPIVKGEEEGSSKEDEPPKEGDEEDGKEKSDDDSKDDDSDNDEEEFAGYDFEKDIALPENYTLPDAAKEALNDMGKELGIPKDKIQGVVDKFIGVNKAYAEADAEALNKQIEQVRIENVETLKKEYGDNFDANVNIMKTAHAAIPEDIGIHVVDADGKRVDFDVADYDVATSRLLLWLGNAIGEDSFEGGGAARATKSLAQRMYKDQK